MVDNSGGYVVGEELIRITLERSYVGLIFQQHGIQLFSIFRVKTPDDKDVEIDASTKNGDIDVLWKLVGSTVKELRSVGGLYLEFNDGTIVSCISGKNRVSGTIQTLDLKTYDEF